jgi:hypothetical protein
VTESTPAVSRTVVLVEGRSDVGVVRDLLGRRTVQHVVEVVSLEGVTNFDRTLVALESEPHPPRVAGLCDAGEARFLVRSLARRGRPVQDAADLPRHGFFVCDTDLEDELIRALGSDVVAEVVEQIGDGPRFAVFANQPEWRGRPVEHQLHRFAGTRSGRKQQLAQALASRLDETTTPPPLRGLLEHVAPQPAH